MEDGYWELFWATGAPLFYLLHRQEEIDMAEAKPACAEAETADV